MQSDNVSKFIIKTDNDKTYSLYIMEADQYQKGKYVALFLYYDDNGYDDSEKLWQNLRHRIFYENSTETIKDKVIEYADGRNEKLIFLQMHDIHAV